MPKKSNNSKNKKISISERVKKHKILTVVLVVLVVIVGWQLFKLGVDRYNIHLLDQAEVELRAMNIPKADSTIYKRTCSVRSVKFQSPGRPSCHITRTDVIENISVQQAKEIADKSILTTSRQYSGVQVSEKGIAKGKEVFTSPSGYIYISNIPLSRRTHCQQEISLDNNDYSIGQQQDTENNNKLTFSTYCSKEFFNQAYPEY